MLHQVFLHVVVFTYRGQLWQHLALYSVPGELRPHQTVVRREPCLQAVLEIHLQRWLLHFRAKLLQVPRCCSSLYPREVLVPKWLLKSKVFWCLLRFSMETDGPLKHLTQHVLNIITSSRCPHKGCSLSEPSDQLLLV